MFVCELYIYIYIYKGRWGFELISEFKKRKWYEKEKGGI